jgi:lysophospholipid acyltransferase (LPLAT)-like uncharacterized protein
MKKKDKFDWSALIQLIGILIKFLFKTIKDKKKAAKEARP